MKRYQSFMESELNISKEQLAEEIRRIVGAENLVVDEETQKPYECDGLSVYCEMPLLVVLPEDKEQVRQVLALCHYYGVPVVARGAGGFSCPVK